MIQPLSLSPLLVFYIGMCAGDARRCVKGNRALIVVLLFKSDRAIILRMEKYFRYKPGYKRKKEKYS